MDAWMQAVLWIVGTIAIAVVLWAAGALGMPDLGVAPPTDREFEDHWARYRDHRSELLRQQDGCNEEQRLGDDAASRSDGSERG